MTPLFKARVCFVVLTLSHAESYEVGRKSHEKVGISACALCRHLPTIAKLLLHDCKVLTCVLNAAKRCPQAHTIAERAARFSCTQPFGVFQASLKVWVVRRRAVDLGEGFALLSQAFNVPSRARGKGAAV